jgi:hypothetical protein
MTFNNHFAEQQFLPLHVRFGSKADIGLTLVDVHFATESDIAGRQLDVR